MWSQTWDVIIRDDWYVFSSLTDIWSQKVVMLKNKCIDFPLCQIHNCLFFEENVLRQTFSYISCGQCTYSLFCMQGFTSSFSQNWWPLGYFWETMMWTVHFECTYYSRLLHRFHRLGLNFAIGQTAKAFFNIILPLFYLQSFGKLSRSWKEWFVIGIGRTSSLWCLNLKKASVTERSKRRNIHIRQMVFISLAPSRLSNIRNLDLHSKWALRNEMVCNLHGWICVRLCVSH